MVTVVNPLNELKTILTNSWLNTNTDGITPTIEKIYTQPKNKNPNPGQDFVYLYSELTVRNPVGIGNPTQVVEINTIKIDVRSRPSATTQTSLVDDSHAYKVKTEVERILYNNFNNPSSNFCQLNPNLDVTDLSDGVRGIFRFVIRVELKSFCKSMV